MLSRPTVRENVRDGCQSRADCLLSACPSDVSIKYFDFNCFEYVIIDFITFKGQCRARWDTTECVCRNGTIGDDCRPICEVKPCGEHGDCIPDSSLPKGYKCMCHDEKLFTG